MFKHSTFHVKTLAHTNKALVSSYSDAKILLECFFRVYRHENTCKGKVGVGGGLSMAARVTMPYTWHGLLLNSMRNSVENLCVRGHKNSTAPWRLCGFHRWAVLFSNLWAVCHRQCFNNVVLIISLVVPRSTLNSYDVVASCIWSHE